MNGIDLHTHRLEGVVRHTRITAWALASAGLLISSSLAQQQPTAAPAFQTQPATSQENSQPGLAGQQGSSSGLRYGTATDSGQPPVREIGRATLLTSELSQLRWGSVFLRSVQFLQAFGPDNGSFGSARDRSVTTSLFQATVAYDKQFRHSRLALQYRPFVGITNGRTYTSFSNRGVDFQTDFYRRLNPRWSMSIAEGLAYHGANSLYTESYFNADAVTATAVHNNFLEGPFESLLSSTSLNFVRALSPRTHLSFGPQFSYGYSSGGYQANTPLSSPTYAGTASLEHALSPSRNVGFSYSFQRILVSRTFANNTYQTLAASYTHQLAPSLGISFSLGASTSDFVGQRQWSPNGSFNLNKTFQRSYLSLAYTRGHILSGYINNGDTQRADVNYGLTVTRRMRTQFGGGYEYTPSTLLLAGLPRAKVSGAYASANVSYQLVRNISWFASYVRRNQRSYDLQVFPGSRDYIATGITWSPGANVSH